MITPTSQTWRLILGGALFALGLTLGMLDLFADQDTLLSGFAAMFFGAALLGSALRR